MRVRRKGKFALALAGIFALFSAVPAGATSIEDEGLWYFDWFKVQDAHDGGITGEGVTIAMIDSQVNLEIPTLADADIRVQDPVCIRADGTRPAGVTMDLEMGSHGTNALSLLVGSGHGFPGQTGMKGLAPGATVLTYYVQQTEDHDAGGGCPESPLPDAITDPGEREFFTGMEVMSPGDELGASMHEAMDAGADIISISMGAGGTFLIRDAVARAVREGVIIVAALPNSNLDIIAGATFPSDGNGVVSVNSTSPDGETAQQDYVDVVAPGESILLQGLDGDWQTQRLGAGNSYATPIVAGNLALARQKYPDATANQLIQSLIHNTGAEPHDLAWDTVHGYGEVITDVFLAADPTQYPDVNPLVYNVADMFPKVDEIWPGAVLSEDPHPPHSERPWPVYTPEPAPPASSPSDDPETPAGPAASPTALATDSTDETATGWLIPAVIVVVLILVAIAIVIAIVVIRTNRPTGGPHGSQ